MKKLNVLQFICSSGFYGAERWVLALAKYLNPEEVNCHLAVTIESGNDELKIIMLDGENEIRRLAYLQQNYNPSDLEYMYGCIFS